MSEKLKLIHDITTSGSRLLELLQECVPQSNPLWDQIQTLQ